MYDLNKLPRLSHLLSGLVRLAGVTAAALEEINTVKAAKPLAVTATLPAEGWKKDSVSAYPYYYDLPVAGVSGKDIASVSLAPGSMSAAIGCGLCPTNETVAGAIRFRANEIPAGVIAVEYEIAEGSE